MIKIMALDSDPGHHRALKFMNIEYYLPLVYLMVAKTKYSQSQV